MALPPQLAAAIQKGAKLKQAGNHKKHKKHHPPQFGKKGHSSGNFNWPPHGTPGDPLSASKKNAIVSAYNKSKH